MHERLIKVGQKKAQVEQWEIERARQRGQLVAPAAVAHQKNSSDAGAKPTMKLDQVSKPAGRNYFLEEKDHSEQNQEILMVPNYRTMQANNGFSQQDTLQQ